MTRNKPDFKALWLEYEKLNGRKPSTRDIESRRIYSGVCRGVAEGREGYAEFYEEHKPKATDWLSLWIKYESLNGKRPSPSDKESAEIYRGVQYGAKVGKPGFIEVFDAGRRCLGQDWIQQWEDYESSTGERPSQTSEASKKIYFNVSLGSRTGREGYKEFFESKRLVVRQTKECE